MNKETKAENSHVSPADGKPPVVRYCFKCRFYKGQILHQKIIEAKNEDDARHQFKKRFPSRNLLEVVPI